MFESVSGYLNNVSNYFFGDNQPATNYNNNIYQNNPAVTYGRDSLDLSAKLVNPNVFVPRNNPTFLDVFNGKISSLLKPLVETVTHTDLYQSLRTLVTTSHKDISGRAIKLNAEAAKHFDKLVNISKQKGVSVRVSSSYRSVEHQAQLFRSAVRKYGNTTAASKWVAPPGKSQHNYGNAIDLSLHRNGKKVSQREFDQIIAEAGFYRPMSYEGWHIEPTSTKKIRSKIAKISGMV